MDQLLGYGIGLIILYIAVQLLIGGLFLYLGAAIAGVEKNSFGKGILGFIVSYIMFLLIMFIFSIIFFFFPPLGWVLGLVVFLLITAAILKGIFSTSFGKAFLAIIMAWIVNGVVIFIILAMAGISLGSFMPV